MTPALASALTPLLRLFDAETAHHLALAALRAGLAGRARADAHPVLATRVFGLSFANPLGLAAGFDKDAEAVLPLFALGFGFIEAGTVTPRPQPGNPRPRLFRLAEDRAVINRMGFNNAGIESFLARLRDLPRPLPGVFGANIGINKEGADPERDYAALYAALAPLVDYVTINISSPNTPGLRDLQAEARLAAILAALPAERRVPVLVKLAPDLPEEALPGILDVCIAGGAAGVVISNTTLARPPLSSRHAGEAGGLSGQPLFARSTEMLRRAYRHARGRLVFIGVGGIATPEQALAKIKAGASLLQLYTGLIYAGPALVPRLLAGLAALLAREGFAQVADAVGVEA
ncbi:MAG: quinone-dependent dihydroorotate dehydrogenase [Rhodovarius sp.]|nr:quinone-dependent dihydroorotate dehydrogenase [Rhodovarius sp.]